MKLVSQTAAASSATYCLLIHLPSYVVAEKESAAFLKHDMEQVPWHCSSLLPALAPPVLPDVQNEAQLALSLRIGVEAGTLGRFHVVP